MLLVPNQSKGKGTRTSFLTNGSEQIALNFFPREMKNMHLVSLVCTCNLLFATCISDFANLPFWSGNMEYTYSVASNLSLVFGPHFFCLQRISCLQTPYLIAELFWWLPSSIFPLSPVSPILVLLDSLLGGKGLLTEKTLNEMKFFILLQCPKFWDNLCYYSSSLLQNVSTFLLMERMEYFLARIIFLSMA